MIRWYHLLKMKFALLLLTLSCLFVKLKSFPCGIDNNIVKVCQCYGTLINCANTRLSFIPQFSDAVSMNARHIDLKYNYISKPRILSRQIWKNLQVSVISKVCNFLLFK